MPVGIARLLAVVLLVVAVVGRDVVLVVIAGVLLWRAAAL